ncbi:MAG: hypothetical protein H6935_04585 [Thiobacillus sp.]|nr:hypothetical protein [Thiobacillus sp.]
MQRRWVYLVVTLAMAPLLAACDQIQQGKRILEGVEKALKDPDTTTLVWDEEVKLHDGRVILIKRREASGGGGFPVSGMNPRGLVQYYEFCYPEMGVYWKSKGGPRYQPEILDIVDGKVYVKVPISGSETCMFHDYPATNAIYFVWENGGWKKIPYEQFPKEIRRTNLLLSAWGRYPAGDVRGRLSVEMKEGRDSIYVAMKQTNGRIQSLTDYPHRQGACEKRRGSKTETTNTSEVFLPPTPDLCQLPELWNWEP